MKRKIPVLILCLMLIFSFSACADDNTVGECTVTRAFINQDYIETGNEEAGIVVLLTANVELDCAEEDKYEEVIELLREEYMPENFGNLKLKTTVSENIKFNDIYLEESTVYVDFKGENLSGGSLQETLVITQIVETLTDSFSEVKNVRLLIDGKEAETLMGHIDISQPFVEGIISTGASENKEPAI
ncbi:MAG: GerMN domain-containing protein [Eubacteriales bacterium]|nr:GerMN domain-containing protein [Eubacteriales bacterium]MDD4389590.1 GerMN domain-containing protein [Eubacteriales bacterium]